jgi:hypothetical protein
MRRDRRWTLLRRGPLTAGATLIARMPTPEEHDEHDIREGDPLLVVTLPDGTVEVCPG